MDGFLDFAGHRGVGGVQEKVKVTNPCHPKFVPDDSGWLAALVTGREVMLCEDNVEGFYAPV
jgi:hypothetical protein